MVKEHGEGAVWQYLEERAQELAAEKEAERQAADELEFAEAFIASGGEPADAPSAYREFRNQRAARQAAEAAEAATVLTRKHIARQL
jgi:hypothetical protein